MNVVVDIEGGDFSKCGHMEYACYVRWYVTDTSIGIGWSAGVFYWVG